MYKDDILYKDDNQIAERFEEIADSFQESKIKKFQGTLLGRACSSAIMAYLVMGEIDNFDEVYPNGLDPMMMLSRLLDKINYYPKDVEKLISSGGWRDEWGNYVRKERKKLNEEN